MSAGAYNSPRVSFSSDTWFSCTEGHTKVQRLQDGKGYPSYEIRVSTILMHAGGVKCLEGKMPGG